MSALQNIVDIGGPLLSGARLGIDMQQLEMAKLEQAARREEQAAQRDFAERQFARQGMLQEREYNDELSQRGADVGFLNASSLFGGSPTPVTEGPTSPDPTPHAGMSQGMIRLAASEMMKRAANKKMTDAHIVEGDGILNYIRSVDSSLAAAVEDPMTREEALVNSKFAKNAEKWMRILSARDNAQRGMTEDGIRAAMETQQKDQLEQIEKEENETLNSMFGPMLGLQPGQKLKTDVMRSMLPAFLRKKMDEIQRPSKIKALMTRYPNEFPSEDIAGAHVDARDAGLIGSMSSQIGQDSLVQNRKLQAEILKNKLASLGSSLSDADRQEIATAKDLYERYENKALFEDDKKFGPLADDAFTKYQDVVTRITGRGGQPAPSPLPASLGSVKTPPAASGPAPAPAPATPAKATGGPGFWDGLMNPFGGSPSPAAPVPAASASKPATPPKPSMAKFLGGQNRPSGEAAPQGFSLPGRDQIKTRLEALTKAEEMRSSQGGPREAQRRAYAALAQEMGLTPAQLTEKLKGH